MDKQEIKEVFDVKIKSKVANLTASELARLDAIFEWLYEQDNGSETGELN